MTAMFKPNVSPILLDQIHETKPTVDTLEDGEMVIIDPEATTERVVLWFYLLINVGGFLAVPSSYLEKICRLDGDFHFTFVHIPISSNRPVVVT
jgi:hypothetical protein